MSPCLQVSAEFVAPCSAKALRIFFIAGCGCPACWCCSGRTRLRSVGACTFETKIPGGSFVLFWVLSLHLSPAGTTLAHSSFETCQHMCDHRTVNTHTHTSFCDDSLVSWPINIIHFLMFGRPRAAQETAQSVGGEAPSFRKGVPGAAQSRKAI